MTDQTLDDQVRKIIEKMHHHANDPYVGSREKRNILVFAQQLAALLPPPPRPTLADMTVEERDAASGASPEDVEAAREWADDVLEGRAAAIVPIEETIARALRAYLPPPPRPTLADMTEEERDECQWMQADDNPTGERVVILNPSWTKEIARVLRETGRVSEVRADTTTPRPDLPRLEWPGTEKPAPVLPDGWRLADHRKRGRVIVTNDAPNAVGHVAYVLPATDPLGYDWFFCRPDDLTYLDTCHKPDTASAVPPNTLAKGSVWDDADALARACEESGRDQITVIDCDGDACVWSAVAGWWETGVPSCGYEPFTILHAGRKADQ